MALGRHAGLVGELEGLVALHGLHERFHEQLMLSLYRNGRQADALRAYQDARRLLAEELGLNPGPALRSMEAAILAQDPTLDLKATRTVSTNSRSGPGLHPAGLDAGVPLVGRQREPGQTVPAVRGLVAPRTAAGQST